MAGNPEDDEPKPLHFQQGAIIIDKPKSAEQTAEERRQRESHDFARDQVRYSKSLRNLTFCLAAASILGTGIGIWQASISQTAANAANIAAVASQDAAQTAGNTLLETQRVNESSGKQFLTQVEKLDASIKEANRLTNATGDQAKETHVFAKQSQRSADIALQSLESSRDADRAWIGIQHFKLIRVLPNNSIKFEFENCQFR